MPFGQLLEEAIPGVFVPVGRRLRPALSPGLLAERLGRVRGGGVRVSRRWSKPPFRIARDTFEVLERKTLARADLPWSPPLGARPAGCAPRRAAPRRPRSKTIRWGCCPCGAGAWLGTGMLRPLVSRFLLPLVKGGQVHVGRPLDGEAVAALVAGWASTDPRKRFAQLGPEELRAGEDLAKARAAPRRGPCCWMPGPPALDESTLRLGAALHNLLLLSHPSVRRAVTTSAAGSGIADAATRLADLGPAAHARPRRYDGTRCWCGCPSWSSPSGW